MIRFVEARLREARAIAETAAADWNPDHYAYNTPAGNHIRRHNPQRVLADIAAKEEIVRQYKDMYRMRGGVGDLDPVLEGWLDAARIAVLEIAKIDKDHEDFDRFWQVYFLGRK